MVFENIIAENVFLADLLVVSLFIATILWVYYSAVFYIFDETVTLIFITAPILLMVVSLWTIHFNPSLFLFVCLALLVFWVAFMVYLYRVLSESC